MLLLSLRPVCSLCCYLDKFLLKNNTLTNTLSIVEVDRITEKGTKILEEEINLAESCAYFRFRVVNIEKVC